MSISKERDPKAWAYMTQNISTSKEEREGWTCTMYAAIALIVVLGVFGLGLAKSSMPDIAKLAFFLAMMIGCVRFLPSICPHAANLFDASNPRPASKDTRAPGAAFKPGSKTPAPSATAAKASSAAARTMGAAMGAGASAKPAAAPAVTQAAAPEPDDVGTRPEALSAARDGQADDLKLIKGVGPALEQLCNKLGFYHFDQIASWTGEEVAWVDANLEGFKGRVTRDDWVSQAKTLAEGGQTEFSQRQG